MRAHAQSDHYTTTDTPQQYLTLLPGDPSYHHQGKMRAGAHVLRIMHAREAGWDIWDNFVLFFRCCWGVDENVLFVRKNCSKVQVEVACLVGTDIRTK